MTTGRVFWVKLGDDQPLKFDYDDHGRASNYSSFEDYFQNFTEGWEDGEGHPIRAKYAVQDAEPDETTVWLDGPSCG